MSLTGSSSSSDRGYAPIPSFLRNPNHPLFRAFYDPYGPEGQAMMKEYLRFARPRDRMRVELFHGKKLTLALLRKIEAFETGVSKRFEENARFSYDEGDYSHLCPGFSPPLYPM